MKTKKPIAEWTQLEIYSVHRELIAMRDATVKAQLDLAQAAMVAPGQTQDALVHELLRFMDEARARFKRLDGLEFLKAIVE